MSLSPLTFTGVSKFSSDLNSILSRAVSIAQVPITALQNHDADVVQQKGLLTDLSTGVANLASSLQTLGTTSAARGLSASSSDTSVITASNTGATAAASYTIDSVTSVAAAASERTLNSYADSAATPVGSTGDFELNIGGNVTDFHLTNNTLVGLRDQINSLGAGVTASILTTADGNYLSVSAVATGQTTLSLSDVPGGGNPNVNLLTSSNQGANLAFSLNGIPVTQSRNLVNNVIPGLTFTVQAASATPVTLSLQSDRTQITDALSTFVTNLNALRDQVSAQVGPGAGLLTGNILVSQLSNQIRQLTSYSSASGSVTSLADLGVTFDNTGKAVFDPSQVTALTDQGVADAFQFLGDGTQGLTGFAQTFSQYSDPAIGLIKIEQDGLTRVDHELQDQEAALTDRLNLMQTGLQLKLQQADSLLADLESQQNAVSASLVGLNSVLYGQNTSSTATNNSVTG